MKTEKSIVHLRAMMIHLDYTTATDRTMMSTQWLEWFASSAIFFIRKFLWRFTVFNILSFLFIIDQRDCFLWHCTRICCHDWIEKGGARWSRLALNRERVLELNLIKPLICEYIDSRLSPLNIKIWKTPKMEYPNHGTMTPAFYFWQKKIN